MQNTTYVKVSVEDELPTEEGKYIVFTETKLGNGNVLNINLHIREKKGNKTYHWSCTNQVVTHWLKEIKN